MIATLKSIESPASAGLSALDEHELTRACIAGDSEAWEEIVRRFGRLVISVARKLGLTADDADEVFQNTFMHLYRHLESIRDRTCLASWLITTARREAYRTGKRSARMETAVEAMLDGEDEGDDRLNAERLELQHRVRQALRQLSQRDQQLLSALFLQAGSPNYETIARDLKMKVGSIGPTRARALERLRQALDQSVAPDACRC